MTGAEMILYAYGAVCVAMLIFNVAYDFFQRGRDERMGKKQEEYLAAIRAELAFFREKGTWEERYFRRLKKTLSRVDNLIAFDRALTDAVGDGADEASAGYQERLQKLLLELAPVYRKREKMEAAYFAYFLSRHKLEKFRTDDAIQELMVEYMTEDNLYCRINAMNALYVFGVPEKIVQAVTVLDRTDHVFNEKILTDGLLTYQGDHERLTELFWEKFDDFSTKVQLCILNYVRFRTGTYTERMFGIMQDVSRDKELRISAIRYFGKYVYEPARGPLLEFARDTDPVSWEYAAIATTSLARYRGDDVVSVLMEGLHSPNWYVRYNAAVSLEAQDLDYMDLIEVVGGRDRYAREMMMYRLEFRRMTQEAQGVKG